MGKKRSRTLPSKKPKDLGPESSIEHQQSLVDDVRETRDLEFAAEKKSAERSKRRKLIQQEKLNNSKRSTPSRQKSSLNEPDPEIPTFQTTLGVADLNKEAIDLRTSSKIYHTARQQRADVRKELSSTATQAENENLSIRHDLHGVGEVRSKRLNHLSAADDDSDEDDNATSRKTESGSDSAAEDHDERLRFLDASKITDEEEVALSLFSSATNPSSTEQIQPLNSQRIMLADIILAKIKEKQDADARAAAIAADPAKAERDKKIAEVYGLIGNIMSKYRSGKVPKAFKVIPKQKNWEDLLYLTRPDEWSPAAMYAGTRLLASNLRAKQVVRYYADILLPRCLDDISENKKLNYHLYKALGKAVYKPEAFCKGILFPLCEDSSCTLRQATIIGSIVAKVSIPMLHSAAALLYICQLPYSPPNSIIITALIDKKYALPYRVLDGIVDCFLQMKEDPRPLPLLWHQSLLCFAQRYKTELSMEQKEQLKLLMRVQTHHGVTPEIRRELFSARNRGDLMDPDANTIARYMAAASVEG